MIPTLKRTGPHPIYKQIEDWMRQQILQGLWPEHYKLKSEDDLALELDVSRGTLRKATDELISEGILVRIHGRGTFVSSHRLEQPLAQRLITFSEDLISKGISFETQVLEQAVLTPSQRVVSLLSLAPNSKAFYLKRVRSVGQKKLILLENYVVHDRCQGIEQTDFTRYRLFEMLEKAFGLELDWGQRVFEAQAADETVAALLGICPKDPIMYVQQLVYLRDGSPVELSDLWIRGDYYRLSAVLERDNRYWLANRLHEVVAPASQQVLGEHEPDCTDR
jgi:DNA-binding GntR family transcriptional regulator